MGDTTPVILAVFGTGITLFWGTGWSTGVPVFVCSAKTSRKPTPALNQRATGLNSRIDALYQALFSHKDPVV